MKLTVTTTMRCPLPEHPELRKYAEALEAGQHFAWIVDEKWRLVYMTHDFRMASGDRSGAGLASLALGTHLFSTEATEATRKHRFGFNTDQLWRGYFSKIGPFVLANTPGGRDELRDVVDRSLADLVDDLEPIEMPIFECTGLAAGAVGPAEGSITLVTLRGPSGEFRGVFAIAKPVAGMNALNGLAFSWDMSHVERMETMTRAGRRPAAMLFGDLEGSTALAARLGAERYFALGRRLVRAADQCVVDAGGVVGRHAGDGGVAFFPAETFASESNAARACIVAARCVRDATALVAKRSELPPEDVVMRFGLHWGNSLFMGRISTVARTEVTALGDEVSEAARIEESAIGGRTLASQNLLERLERDDATALDLDPTRLRYMRLSDLTTATTKARRDAPEIAVCEL